MVSGDCRASEEWAKGPSLHFFVLAGNFYNFFTGARPLDRAKVFGVWRVVYGVQDAFQKICTFRGVCSGADVWPCG